MRFMLLVAGIWSILMLVIHKKELKKSNGMTKGFFFLCLGVGWAIWVYVAVAKQTWYPTVWVGRVIHVLLPF